MIRPEFPTLTTPEFDSERAVRIGAGAIVAPLWTAFAVTAAAGAAFWWMTAWTRRPETRSFAPQDAADTAPEAVMAHQPEPEVLPEPPTDDTTSQIVVAPEEVMEHAPAEPAPAQAAPVETVAAEAAPVSATTSLDTVIPAVTREAAPSAETAIQAAVEAVAPAARKPVRKKVGPTAQA
ncbi:MAG TPA: hypothetical protein VD929_00130 [Caulobacteraceae bacterium]|nr:hypothetical protein [Caulobacteraceae bacterium]